MTKLLLIAFLLEIYFVMFCFFSCVHILNIIAGKNFLGNWVFGADYLINITVLHTFYVIVLTVYLVFCKCFYTVDDACLCYLPCETVSFFVMSQL